MNCGGDLFGGGVNLGDFIGNDDIDGNVCSINYFNGDDYIFIYIVIFDDVLQFDLYVENIWIGIMVIEGCLIMGICFVSVIFSFFDELLMIFFMMLGIIYYIYIFIWLFFQFFGQFCLDVVFVDLIVEVSCGMLFN